MSIKLSIPIEEFARDLDIIIRESSGTDFLREIEQEVGQTLITKRSTENKTKKEVYYLNKEVFSLERKVKDNIRFRINIAEEELVDGNEIVLSEKQDSYKIAIILESPHRDEYNYSYKYYAKKPANGLTGINIENSIFDFKFWQILSDEKSVANLINNKKKFKNILESTSENIILGTKALFKNDEESYLKLGRKYGMVDDQKLEWDYLTKNFCKENIDIYVVNRICYQTSLGSYYKGGLIKPIRNSIFKNMWLNNEIRSDFYNRLFGIKPDLIINSSTKEVDKKNYDFTTEIIKKIKEESALHNVKLFISNHPSSGLISNNLKRIM